MSKKLNWLDKFAQEQAKKEAMKKEASLKRVANQIIVSPEDVPNAQEGQTVEFNGEQFKVVDANYFDEIGPGVVLERVAAYEGLKNDPMGMAMGAPASSVTTPSSQGQQYARTKLPTQETYNNDQDAQWGQSSAPATEQEIAGENAVDRTTVPGHYTKSPGLNTAPAGLNGVAPTDATTAPVGTTNAVPTQDAASAAGAETYNVETEEKEEKENKILSKVKATITKKAKTTRTAMNTCIVTLANDVTDAIVAETEDILEDAEEAVKELVPAHLAAKALELLEKELEDEGIEALFDKTVKLNKTAGEEDMTEDEVKEVVKKVAEAVVEEMEDVLKDADEVMDAERETLAENEDEEFEVEAKLKSMVERKLHAKGIYSRFARTAKKAVKKQAAPKTIAEKIREARKAKARSVKK